MKTEPLINITENRPFIHPEILITVGKNIDPNTKMTLDSAKFEEAKNNKRDFKSLFYK